MFSVLLMEDRLKISLEVDGRTADELQDTLGLFRRWVPFKCPAEDHLTFFELIENVKRELKLVLDWQDYYRQEHDSFSHSIGFSYETLGGENPRLFIQYDGGERRDLHLNIAICQEGDVYVRFFYNEAVYTEKSIHILVEQFISLCERVCINPNRSIQENSLLPESLRSLVMNEWSKNPNQQELKKVHEMFDLQAIASPDSTALDDGKAVMTYWELKQHVDQLSSLLTNAGVESGDMIAIYMEKSMESIVSALGVLKAGAAFLPLDANDPANRIQNILSDSRPKMVLTTKDFTDRAMFKSDHFQDPVHVNGRLFAISASAPSKMDEADLAYIIYTSGSTGKAKGVKVSHQNLSNHLNWAKQLMCDPVEYLPFITRMSFDMSMKQFLGPLIVGKSVWIIPEKKIFDIPIFVKEISKRKNIGINCVPTLWKKVVDYLEKNSSLCNKMTVIELTLGGEILDEHLVKRTWRLLPSIKINNFYGPTETTGNATGGTVVPNEAVTIGKPAYNYEVYILNKKLEPVAVGVAGEICIGGKGLAEGYLHKEALTKEKFVAAESLGNQLVYKTGDRGRMRSDGRFECLGRFDYQIKLRGFRVEIGEIETCLEQHPTVIEAAVKLLRHDDKDGELVAYLVVYEGIGLEDIRAFLQTKLPEYMIPSAFICVEELPKSASGKIDRKALPNPGPSNQLTYQGRSLPSNQLEETLLSMYQNLLNAEQLEVDKSFFELGGHSLLATQLIAQIWETFKVEVPLSFLYEGATIRELGEKIERLLQAETGAVPIFLQAARQEKIPAALTQKNLWMLERELGDTPFLKVLLPLQLKGEVDIEALKASIDELIHYHEPLRTNFYEVNGELYQRVSEHDDHHKTIEWDLSHLPPKEKREKIRAIVMKDLEKPFDFKNDGPVLKSSLIKVGSDDYLLTMVLHHINCDGVSLGILTEDLSKIYKAYTENRPVPIEKPNIQYADYAVWEMNFLKTDACQEQLNFWLRKLGACHTRLNLPYDFPEPDNGTYLQSVCRYDLGGIRKALHSFNKRNNVSMFVTLLSALKAVLFRYAPENIVQIGTMFANRHRSQLSRAVGLFSNNVVIQTKLENNQSFIDLVNDVRHHVIEAQIHSDVPFEMVADILESQKGIDRSELCQIAFNYEIEPAIEETDRLKIEQAKIMDPSENIVPTSFDIECSATVTNENFYVQFQFNADRFKKETIESLTNEYVSFLEASVNQTAERFEEETI
ncbi:amino acid adenylation domain-containing protein [Bacillus paralicheniformis]|uniref:amino acid adenylation domain-containing protein n=3 Tax=Bacillus paralicheniformis TaxID=1648923 RepID=UPI002DB62F8E|nr:amino acid adenylation domain-containing protein [Bacillus paralicheniformis]